MKKIISSFLILSIFANTTGVYAGRKKSKSIRKKDNTETQTHSKQETQQDTGLRPVTCMEKYNICMDKVCVNTQGLRYNCSTSLNSFESVNIEGENFRIGDDLYTFAKGLCSSTIKSCNLKEQNHIQTQYIAKIQEDLLSKNYFDAINAESDETQTALLQEYINCMAPLCGTNFKDCFTIKNIERRSPNCENILASSAKPLSVKKMFFDEIKKQRKDFCAKRDGYIDYQTKVCKVKVVFGNPEIIETEQGAFYGGIAKEVASKYVNVGEMVECTQDYFSTTNVRKDLLERGIKDLAVGAVQAVAGVALVVVGVVGTIASFGAASPETVSMIMNGAGLMAKSTASTLNGAVKINTDTNVGACFINNQVVAELGTYFKVDFQ